MKEIERAINLISEGEIDYSGIYDCELNERVTEVILNALREQAEREKGCEYCSNISKYAGFGYAEWFEQKAADDLYEISVDVKFCPNCGRDLRKEVYK